MRKNSRFLVFLISGILIFLFVLINSCNLRKEIKLDPESEHFYRRARLLMTKYEEEVFFTLPDERARHDFIKLFWEIRDPDPYTEINEYKMEIDRRFRYAERYLKEPGRPGWNTDRGRIFILLGPPDEVKDYPMLSGYYKGIIYWVYGNYQLVLRFVDTSGDGIYNLDIPPSTMIQLSEAMEKAKFVLISGRRELNFLKSIKFRAEYSDGTIVLKIKNKNLLFKKEKNIVNFKFYVKLVVYYDDKTFEKKEFEITKEFNDREFLNKKEIILSKQIRLKKKSKKLIFDIILSDLYSGIRTRKIFKFKNKI